MDNETFRRHAHELVDWVADYMDEVEQYPVLPRTTPGQIRAALPDAPPEGPEPMADILRDFETTIVPGLTHWNHPRFFAYFPSNHSGPSILGELLSAGLGVNAMAWQTCPSATELEETVMDWLRQAMALPSEFRGAIQDTASTATLCALLCAREAKTGWRTNQQGLGSWDGGTLRVYASGEAHSSVEKAVRLAGFGSDNLVKAPVDKAFALDPVALERLIEADRAAGMAPCALVGCIGTTSSTAVDPVAELAAIARRHGLWFHIDAALAGSAALLPEMAPYFQGWEGADSIVFNPHKWLLTNFDCSVMFCRRWRDLVRTMSIMPEYLRSSTDGGAAESVTNFRDWSIPLGRRFRALKLWFVIRSYGMSGLRDHLRRHVDFAREFAGWVDDSPDFERLAPAPFNTVCFRYNPWKGSDPPDSAGLDARNQAIMEQVNRQGEIFISHTRLDGVFTLRFSSGQTRTGPSDVRRAWVAIGRAARS